MPSIFIRTVASLLVGFFFFLAAEQAQAKRVTFYVSTQGNDAWSGTRVKPNRKGTEGPFATLERALDEVCTLAAADSVRTMQAVIELQGGAYEIKNTLRIADDELGSAKNTLTIRGRKGAEVRLVGGKRIERFQPVSDRDILDRLDESVRGNVVQADLKQCGVTDFGEAGGGGLELFFNDEPMTISRWPNEGFTKITGLAGNSPTAIHGAEGDSIGMIHYEGDRQSRWKEEKDPWAHGYWFWDWSEQRQRIESIDQDKRIITLAKPYHGYGYRLNQWYYGFNLLCEIDTPGEWYLDRETAVLYFLPPSPVQDGNAVVSVIPTLFVLKDVSNITLENLTLEACRSHAIEIEGGSKNTVVRCRIRNVGRSAVIVRGGTEHRVTECVISDTGQSGVSLEGGDRITLTPAGHLADHNEIYRYGRWNRMYTSALSLNGVGNVARNNLLYDGPHTAIFFTGNDHLMELNEIHHVCLEANDAGAIYAGRDWTWRGNVIRYNYFHDITGYQDKSCMGVYLDDMLCGTTIVGNVFLRVARPAFIGGGRDNIVENNIFIDSKTCSVHVDARASNWAAYHVETTMTELLQAMPYQQPPWSERYPDLLGILDDQPELPKGNMVRRNIHWGGDKWQYVETVARDLVTFYSNLTDQDPLFVDAENEDFRLQRNSPAYKMGFEKIPFRQIGVEGRRTRKR